MDYLKNKNMFIFYLIVATSIACCEGFGFDSGATCSEKTARRGRAQLLKSIPCDLSVQAYCNLPGSMYPWNAVRRFVSENQGMMKRMYGDVRHISVLRNEINNNDITLDDVEEAAKRYSRAGWKRNKYLYQETVKTKNNDLLSEAYYRRGPNPHIRGRSTARTTQKTNTMSTSESTTYAPITSTTPGADIKKVKTTEKREKMAIISAKQTHQSPTKSQQNESEYEEAIEAAIEEIYIQFNDENSNNGNNLYLNGSDQRTNGKIPVETTPKTTTTTTNLMDDNIKVVGAPDLSNLNSNLNKSEPAPTISTTLRIYGFLKEEKVTTLSPIERNTTENSTVKADELRAEEIDTTVKTKVNDNLVQIEFNEQDVDDSIPIKTESILETDDFDKDKLDKTEKPFDDQPIGPLYQDVAEKEDPIFQTSRGINACPVKEEVVAPFWANNTRGEVLALLNLYPFEQYVHWEKCTQEHKQMYCRDGCRCEQQYRLHRLLAYDPHNECRGIFSDWFRFPSCCICKCYNVPFEYRVTSRSPRSMSRFRSPRAEKLSDSDFNDDDDEWYRKEAYSNDESESIFADADDDSEF